MNANTEMCQLLTVWHGCVLLLNCVVCRTESQQFTSFDLQVKTNCECVIYPETKKRRRMIASVLEQDPNTQASS